MYIALAVVSCEITWLQSLLKELKVDQEKPIALYCDNQSAQHYRLLPIHFFTKTKYIEIDCHFVREKVQESSIKF